MSRQMPRFSVQPIAEGHQFIDFSDNTVLFWQWRIANEKYFLIDYGLPYCLTIDSHESATKRSSQVMI